MMQASQLKIEKERLQDILEKYVEKDKVRDAQEAKVAKQMLALQRELDSLKLKDAEKDEKIEMLREEN